MVPFAFGMVRTWLRAELGFRAAMPSQGSYVGDGTTADRNAMASAVDFSAWLNYANLALAAGAAITTPAIWPPPAWATDSTTPDGMGIAGGAGRLLKAQYASDYSYCLVTALNGSGTRHLAYMEGRNEPNFEYSGSVEELVRETWYMRAGAKAADPGITILSPSLTTMATIEAFLTTRDSVSGRYGYETFDVHNLHIYFAGPHKGMAGNCLFWIQNGINELNCLYARLGLPRPRIACSEHGLSDTPGSPVLQRLYGLTGPERQTYIERLLTMGAAERLEFLGLFSYWNASIGPGGGSLIGDFRGDPWVQAGLNSFGANAVGRPVIDTGWYPDGRTAMYFADGSSYIR